MGTAARSPPVAGQPPAAPSPLPTLRPDLGDDTLYTVYCFIRDFIGWVSYFYDDKQKFYLDAN